MTQQYSRGQRTIEALPSKEALNKAIAYYDQDFTARSGWYQEPNLCASIAKGLRELRTEYNRLKAGEKK